MTRLRLLLLLNLLLLWPAFSAAGQTLTPIYERPPAPDFSLPDLLGNRISLADYRGRTVVINFWASWCPPCVNELPSIKRGAEWLAQHQVSFITINIGEEPKTVTKFLSELDLDIPVLLDQESQVASRWRIDNLPATYVVDPDGRFAYRVLGARQWDDPVLLVPIRSLTKEKR